MLIYSDDILIDRFQVKTQPVVRFFGQSFRQVYKILAASAYRTGNYGLHYKWDFIIDFHWDSSPIGIGSPCWDAQSCTQVNM